jgi:hypothetical protein
VAFVVPDGRATMRGARIVRVCPAWSGQRMPTAAGVMHSVQIGRPHSEHDSPVSRSGWR